MGVLNKDIWHKEAKNLTQRNNVQPRRWGMMVTVTEDATAGNNTTWVLVRSLVDTNKNNNSNWQKIVDWLSGGLSSNIVREYFNGDDVTTAFDISQAGTVFQVEVGGQVIEPVAGAAGYTVSGTTVTLGFAPATGQRVGIYYITDLVMGTDYLAQAEVDTSGSPIVLDMLDKVQRMFKQSADIGGNKTIELSNDGNALVFQFSFAITGALYTLTWPAEFLMQSTDLRWNDGTKIWAPTEIGTYEASATWNGTNWLLKISDAFN